MNAAVANLILARIEAANLPWVDKTAGLTRAISFGASTTRPGTWPIACTVNDPLACDASTIAELLPDERYNSILFFEGETFPSKQRSKQIPGLIELVSKLRVVVWLNCSRLGGDCDCGSLAAQNLIGAIESPRRRYASGPLIDIQHTVIGGGPARGREIFSRYTFNEDRSQYLHFPFDFFAIDIETTYRIAPGCEDQVEQDNVNCWTGPEMIRRRHPKDFTCEELQDATNGLTEEQLGPECLDCSGSAPCAAATVSINGTQVASDATPCGAAIALEVVDQDGNPIGSLVSGQWVVTIPEEVNNILPYADEAAALADNVTIPATNQLVVITATGRTYWGDGVSAVDVLVGGLSYLLPVTEVPADKLLRVEVFGDNPSIQLNS